MTEELASVIIIIVACGTIIYFVKEFIKTIDNKSEDEYYKYYFTFLVAYSTPSNGITNVYVNVPIIERTYDKALRKAITPLLEKVGEQILKYEYELKTGWLLGVDCKIVK